ncbi:MAG: hypothetical protein AAFP85_07245 [Pseudomonadota bacterium]
MFAFSPAIPSRSDLDWCWYLRRQGKAGEQLERILHDIGVMHPGGWADWAPSSLTDTGAPVTLTFRKGDTGLELMTEVADPDSDPTNRVNEVCKIMEDLGATPPSAALRDVISAAQGDVQLRYGARLGLRHDGTNCQVILYAELPAAACDLLGLMLSAPVKPALDEIGDSAKTTMLAYNAHTKDVTIYWVVEGADRTILPALAAPAAVSHDALSRAIDEMEAVSSGPELPTRKLGFSYTAKDAKTAPELTLYFSAKHMFGTDDEVERRVRACGGDEIDPYIHLMDIRCDAPAGRARHTLVSMTADQDNDPTLAISVAAPWHCPFEAM